MLAIPICWSVKQLQLNTAALKHRLTALWCQILAMLMQVQAKCSLDAECAQQRQAPVRVVASGPATQQESKQVRLCFGLFWHDL
jgi:hypothetical protein